MAVMQSSTYLYQNKGGDSQVERIRFSICCIVISLNTTETGEPMGRPRIYWYNWSSNLKFVADRQSLIFLKLSANRSTTGNGGMEVKNFVSYLSTLVSKLEPVFRVNCIVTQLEPFLAAIAQTPSSQHAQLVIPDSVATCLRNPLIDDLVAFHTFITEYLASVGIHPQLPPGLLNVSRMISLLSSQKQHIAYSNENSLWLQATLSKYTQVSKFHVFTCILSVYDCLITDTILQQRFGYFDYNTSLKVQNQCVFHVRALLNELIVPLVMDGPNLQNLSLSPTRVCPIASVIHDQTMPPIVGVSPSNASTFNIYRNETVDNLSVSTAPAYDPHALSQCLDSNCFECLPKNMAKLAIDNTQVPYQNNLDMSDVHSVPVLQIIDDNTEHQAIQLYVDENEYDNLFAKSDEIPTNVQTSNTSGEAVSSVNVDPDAQVDAQPVPNSLERTSAHDSNENAQLSEPRSISWAEASDNDPIQIVNVDDDISMTDPLPQMITRSKSHESNDTPGPSSHSSQRTNVVQNIYRYILPVLHISVLTYIRVIGR